MLDPQNDFNSPCYDDTFRRNYFFKEYRDFGEYFLELDYWIMREAFVSRIGSPLNLDQAHYDTGGRGAKIFRDLSDSERASIVSRGYFLGDETVECGTSAFGDIYHVTELYVYVPKNGADSKVFSSYSSEVVNFPALVDFDYNLVLTYKFNEVTFLCGLEEVGFATDKLAIGDEFFIEHPYELINRTEIYECRSSMMAVSRREGNLVFAKASSFVNPYNGNSYTAKAVLFDYRNTDGGTLRVKMPTKKYAERSLQVSVRKETAFFASKPAIREKFAAKDQLTGIETGQIDSGTTPTFSHYKNEMMGKSAEIRSAPSTVEEVYKGLWRRDDFYTVAR